MELWIRSQDRKMLTKTTCIEYGEWNKEYKIYVDGNVYGKYKTKERALEVLDEIQNVLNLKDMYEYDRELILKSWENVDEGQVKIVRQQMSVYEMPLD